MTAKRQFIVASVVLALACACCAQDSAPQVNGEVIAIVHDPGDAGTLGRVRVTVRTHNGTAVSFDEWDALWARGERYRVGETIAIEVFERSELGLTSRKWSVASGQWPAKKGFAKNDGDPLKKVGPDRSQRTKCSSDDGADCARRPVAQ